MHSKASSHSMELVDEVYNHEMFSQSPIWFSWSEFYSNLDFGGLISLDVVLKKLVRVVCCLHRFGDTNKNTILGLHMNVCGMFFFSENIVFRSNYNFITNIFMFLGPNQRVLTKLIVGNIMVHAHQFCICWGYHTFQLIQFNMNHYWATIDQCPTVTHIVYSATGPLLLDHYSPRFKKYASSQYSRPFPTIRHCPATIRNYLFNHWLQSLPWLTPLKVNAQLSWWMRCSMTQMLH